jgi:hypothetical protein
MLSMEGTNRSIHHLDSILVPVDMVATGLWGKYNLEVCKDCWDLRMESCRHFACTGIFLLYHRYKICSYLYDHHPQLELRSYRIERIMIIRPDRKILLFLVNNLLCFKGDELR